MPRPRTPLPALVAARIELGLLDLVVAGDWLIRAKHASLSEVRQGARRGEWSTLSDGPTGR